MIEVTKAGWDNNDSTYTGGLRLPLGGGKVVMTKPGPFYLLCSPLCSFYEDERDCQCYRWPLFCKQYFMYQKWEACKREFPCRGNG